MSGNPPVYDAPAANEEQKRLVVIFNEIETKQLEFLDESGKRIIELTTALLGVLFAVVAFGDKFPPPYIAGSLLTKFLAIVILICYVGAMLMGLRTAQPRDYKRYRHNLDGMRNELDRIIENKSRSLWLAGILFWLGSALLALLIGVIILDA